MSTFLWDKNKYTFKLKLKIFLLETDKPHLTLQPFLETFVHHLLYVLTSIWVLDNINPDWNMLRNIFGVKKVKRINEAKWGKKPLIFGWFSYINPLSTFKLHDFLYNYYQSSSGIFHKTRPRAFLSHGQPLVWLQREKKAMPAIQISLN